MKPILSLFFIAIAFTVSAEETPKDYVNAGTQIEFNNSIYNLKWSDNPSKDYYKQEYLQSGSTLEDYDEMITVDVLVGNITPQQACLLKVEELKERKKTDPVTNYAVYDVRKGDEIILDFCISDGKKILEWNLYRYMDVKKGSKKYIVLVAYTNRGDLKDPKKFFANLKSNRDDLIVKLDEILLPNMK